MGQTHDALKGLTPTQVMEYLQSLPQEEFKQVMVNMAGPEQAQLVDDIDALIQKWVKEERTPIRMMSALGSMLAYLLVQGAEHGVPDANEAMYQRMPAMRLLLGELSLLDMAALFNVMAQSMVRSADKQQLGITTTKEAQA